MPIPREQLRLTDDELDALLRGARTLRIGTVSEDGWPHVVPLWFVWHGGSIYVSNLRRSKRSKDLAAGSPAALCIDDGEQYQELRGAVLYGRFHEAEPEEDLSAVRAEFARKYWGGADVPEVKSHVWLRLQPERVVSWDFRKIPQGRDRRLESGKQQG
jgi:nitroimidazol reductase NimA-like FMN-containing flavoprotein (pyridoxamine 5'-phosphate oxidase superfamily)